MGHPSDFQFIANNLRLGALGRAMLSILNQMKTSKIDGHFRIYVAFFGAKKEVIEFLNLGTFIFSSCDKIVFL